MRETAEQETSFWYAPVRGLVLAALVALAAPAAHAASDIETFTTPAGIEVWLKNEPAIPILALDFAFRGGASLDPAGREGLANMVSGLLDEGAGELDSQAFQSRLDELSIGLSFSAGRDEFHGSLTTLTENQDEAFDLLALALAEPRFDPEPVERIRGQLTIRLMQDAEDPSAVAWRAFSEAAFPGHVYGRPVEGTRETIAAITAEDLQGFVDGAFARDRLIVAAVGDIDAATLAPLVDRAFAALPETGTTVAFADVTAQAGRVEVIDMAVPQSAIAFGLPGIGRHDPDFFAAFVLNKALGGGGLNTRLFEEVRKKRGLAYSVGTYLYSYDHSALWLGSVGTQNARAGETLQVIRDVLADVAANGITEAELDDARDYLTGSFPLQLSTNAGIASMLVTMQLDRLGPDYIDERNAFIEAVTAEDVGRVAARLLDPDNLLVVVTGQPEGISATDTASQ